MASRQDPSPARRLGSSEFGAVYTPPILANWVAQLLARSVSIRTGRVLDPACGDGELICAALERIPGLTKGLGYDISFTAVEATSRRHSNIDAQMQDAICTEAEVDAVIMNPPWGSSLAQSTKELAHLGYELAKGQYNSWDIFVEWACKRLGEGTAVAMILPDSFFMTQHKSTRSLLAGKASIDVIARIGEGWFPGIYRGACIVVFRVGTPPKTHKIRFIHVNADARDRALKGEFNALSQSEANGSLSVQSTWIASGGSFIFPRSIDVGAILGRSLTSASRKWSDLFVVSRGVEIGKNGFLDHCKSCNVNLPPARIHRSQCPICKAFPSEWIRTSAISLEHPGGATDDWRPLIVGEDVRRYRARPSRWIRLGMKGVNYKPLDRYRPHKLLIRKTGLGLQAAVDESGALTTQVVFSYVAKTDSPDFMVRYVEGVLNSRTMLAIHLSTTGDLEWRSHPYVTPSILAELPIPIPIPGTDSWKLAQLISELALKEASSDPNSHSVEMDELVSELLRLTNQEKCALRGVLEQVQDLVAFSGVKTNHEAEVAA